MLSVLHSPAVRRISAFVNAAVVLLVLLGVFIGINWDQMPGGLGDFLAMRITVKNLLVAVICLVGGASAFHVFGLTKPAPNVSFLKELVRVTKACTVAAVFALLFPLTSHTGAFTDRIAFYFLPIAIVACLCGRFTARLCTNHLAHTLNGPRDLIIVGSGSRAVSLYKQL